MRDFRKSWYVVPMAIAGVLGAQPAAAQIDINPPLPNVLLLVDTSGSMEYMPDGSLPSVCTPGNLSSELNRWGSLVTVLTGTVQNRSCYAQSRYTTAFANEFGLDGERPYDFGYSLRYHRIVSKECVVGPGTLPVSIYDWPSGAIGYHKWNSTDPCDAGEWDQAQDGLLDTFRDRVRFGLMTFDSHPDVATGVSGVAPDYAAGMQGMWSYFMGWYASGVPAAGNPPDCATHPFEVGARNPAAPPWEGRLISMGLPDAPTADVRIINEQIQQALLAMRPYGATPLAGMMEDAYTFFHEDDFPHPFIPGEYFAPAKDPFFGDGCRGTYIIVLSDGEPNLDLRPHCETGNGVCPFRQPYEVAHELANNATPGKSIKTFAVGFGLSSGAGFDCSTLNMPDDFDAGGICDLATGSLRACCNLARIAYEGDTEEAYFADDMTTLREKLSEVLAIVAAGSTSRTLPSFASGTAVAPANAPAKAYEFVSSFEPITEEGLWEGNLERKRWVCEDTGSALEAQLVDIDRVHGDDFAANVNEGKAMRARRFLTAIGTKTGGLIHSQRTIRPLISGTNDGLGTYSGAMEDGGIETIADAVQLAPEAMGLVPMPAQCSDDALGASTAGECASRVMRWNLGGTNTGLEASRSGHEFGAIYHSSPFVHGNPKHYLRDESYAVFAATESTRPLMLYTATTDGQLHAFKVAPNDPDDTEVLGASLENNELWSFLPPSVLPNILSMYPTTQQILLDGQVVVKDVVFERTEAQAIAGGGAGGAAWRTVLVSGGGGAGGFYYALDVTDPSAPVFLWQLSTDELGVPLFGPRVGTAAITTLAVEEGSEVKEIAVAILPGGEGVLQADLTCTQPRQTTSYVHIDPVTGTYRPRTAVRCWEDGPARSLTIVRLNDGKVLASFRGKTADGPATLDNALVRVVPFDSPLTGTPVPYPSQTGEVSDRIYIGDADGTLWRVDLTDPDPLQWTAHIAFDAYSLSGDAYDDGERVDIPPVVAIDGVGNTIVLFATGDQQTFTATGTMKTRLWSITEIPKILGTVPFQMKHNWLIPFEEGKRVTGPLALFDEVAYFSTFTPTAGTAGASVCSDGFGSIWGVDYVQSQPEITGPYPLPRLAEDPNAVPLSFVHEIEQDPGCIVFGVMVQQVPSCYATEDVPDTDTGTHTAISQSSPPSYQLVYQTGTGGTTTGGAKTRTSTRVLPALSEMSRINSWASIVE